MADQDEHKDARRYQAPYSARHPIPTVSKYREEKDARKQHALQSEKLVDHDDASNAHEANTDHQDDTDQAQKDGDEQPLKDTSQVDPASIDPARRRKLSKDKRLERAEREVTDPVTHLPVKIHDFTDEALQAVDVNEPPFGLTKKTATGLEGKNKSDDDLRDEKEHAQGEHSDLVNRFPPPDMDLLRQEITLACKGSVTMALTGAAGILAITSGFQWVTRGDNSASAGGRVNLKSTVILLVSVTTSIAVLWALLLGLREWTAKKVNSVIEDHVWQAQRQQMESGAGKHGSETTLWLNSLLSSVWPLINPDLFISVADTLEDVMQASLPKLVQMVSVDDIGQGSESMRILGIRWLPTGAAAKTVTEDGKLKSEAESSSEEERDRQTNGSDNPNQGDEQMMNSGMEAEEGDFINLEVAFAYRTWSTSKSIKERSKDMHLCLAFYLPGNLKIPVWVDLQGIIGTMRLRLQLTPDPPFFALCTLTFLGQPKVNVSCVPLSQRGLNIMDVPFISNFVQSAVDAAMAQYVAPKSLTLDLKDMLAGDDFKKDTNAKGVLMINIKRGYDFKVADNGIPLLKSSGSDPYVSIGWAKFGKVLWSTRVLVSEMEPHWDETCFVLVSPEELNIDERLRVQLWDSDRFTADDDLGRIEVDLKELMQNPQSQGQMWHRTDGFRALKSGEDMPGKLEWSVGYFAKAPIQQCQFDQQTYDTKVRSMEQLKEKVDKSCAKKLREAMLKDSDSDRSRSELEQQKGQELKTEQDAIITSAPPPDGYPSGLFSLQIHNITGLEVQRLSKKKDGECDDTSDEETGEGLPSAYCTVIINHKKTYKTRTKPQNSKPYFNAGCERFIRDWTKCEVYVTVRDARLHEDNPLMGIVHLPLSELFKDRSQVNGFWPLSGGVGHGRIRLSMVWRSVQLQAPRGLLGWQIGTVNVQPIATALDCPEDLKSAKLKLSTDIGFGKMYARGEGKGEWMSRQGKSFNLAVHQRHSSCLSIAFKNKSSLFGDGVSAFSVCWLKDLPDDEEQDLELAIWKGDFKRATTCCMDEYGERIGTLRLKIAFWAGMVRLLYRRLFFFVTSTVLLTECNAGFGSFGLGKRQ